MTANRLPPDLRPRCPHCGEPARTITMVAKVICELDHDGSVGRVLRAGKRKPDTEAQYECGGHHIFTANPVS
jgi:hypothetical protein